jgi:hypothetical protein
MNTTRSIATILANIAVPDDPWIVGTAPTLELLLPTTG